MQRFRRGRYSTPKIVGTRAAPLHITVVIRHLTQPILGIESKVLGGVLLQALERKGRFELERPAK
jgi:hypothetical protein